jgi:energy-coupling factor transporter transmembrane protein EcfT
MNGIGGVIILTGLLIAWGLISDFLSMLLFLLGAIVAFWLARVTSDSYRPPVPPIIFVAIGFICLFVAFYPVKARWHDGSLLSLINPHAYSPEGLVKTELRELKSKQTYIEEYIRKLQIKSNSIAGERINLARTKSNCIAVIKQEASLGAIYDDINDGIKGCLMLINDSLKKSLCSTVLNKKL